MRWFWVLVLGIMASMGWAQGLPRGLEVRIDSVFEFPGSNGALTSPQRVTISNEGPPLQGRLVRQGYMESGNIPLLLDVPTGGTKEYLLPATRGAYIQSVSLETNRGTFQVNANALGGASWVYEGARIYLYIADEVGGFQWPEAKGTNAQQSNALGFCRTNDAPGRVEMYDTVSTIFLGGGTDQLSDEAVEALRLFTLSGGTLIFLGVAGGAAVDDPRWEGVNPVRGRIPTVFAPPFKLGMGAAPFQQPLSGYQYESLAPSAREIRLEGQPAMAAKPYGKGRSVFLGLDIRDPLIAEWDWRDRFLYAVAGSRREAQDAIQYGETKSMVDARSVNAEGQQEALRGLPSSTQVWFIFLAFAVIVGPVNFFILAKLKKPDWAWGTSPLIAMGFAGYFLFQARGLYNLPPSSLTIAKSVGVVGEPLQMAWTTTGMFFPRAGQYDLGLQGVTGVESSGGPGWFGGQMPSVPGDTLRLVDVGRYQLLPIQATNLSFLQYSYRQSLAIEAPIEAKWEPGGRLVLTNRGERELRDVLLSGIKSVKPAMVASLAPGKSTTFQVEFHKAPERMEFRQGWESGLASLEVSALQNQPPTAPIGNFGATDGSSLRWMLQVPVPRSSEVGR